MEYVMGLDVGTTGCKATVFDRGGNICTQAYREYPIQQYNGLIDPNMIWDHVQQVMAQTAKDYPNIVAITTASFGESVVLVDKNGDVLCDTMLYTNSNAEAEWKMLNDKLGADQIYNITGHISHAMFTVNRLIWIKDHQPEIYEKVDKFLFIASFIEYRLCGAQVTEDTLAARSMTYDLRQRCWSSQVMGAGNLEPAKMAPIVSAGDCLGTIKPELQAKLGITAQTKIFAGGHDQPVVALGMGAIRGGDAALGMGTVECMSCVMDDIYQNQWMQEGQFVCAPHVVPGKFMTYGVLFSGGVVVREVRNKFYTLEHAKCQAEGTDAYHLMFEEAANCETDVIYHPYLVGTGTPHMDTTDVGVIYGMRLSTTRGEILRGAIEGLGFDMRQNIDTLRKAGVIVKNIKVSGGGAKSEIGLQIRADAMGEALSVPADVQAGTRGAFLISAKSMGWIDDYDQVTCEIAKTFAPQAETVSAMDKKYQRFVHLYTALQSMKSI